MVKRILLWAGLILAALFSVYVFLGEQAVGRARVPMPSGETPAKTSGGWGMFNSRLAHARARAFFDEGVRRLGESASRDAYFVSAYELFGKSLVLNPFSATTHFDFAQALQYLNALDFPASEKYFDEYRKAAGLSGADTAVNLEVGKVLMARWAGLTPDERLFTEKISRTLLAYEGPERAKRAETLLNLWELNIRDDQVLQRILPEDAGVLRQAADFLGGKGIFLPTRLEFLARAESLELKQAEEEVQLGLNERNARRPAQALGNFRAAQRLLDGIRFYQDLTERKDLMNAVDFRNIRKAAGIGVLKCLLDTAVESKDLLEDFRSYLAVEDSLEAVGELESLLEARGIADPQSRAGFIDLARLSFNLELDFKQSRYREIVQTGQSFIQNILVVPEDQRRSYGRTFELIGDAAQRLDDLYESNDFYERALEMNPGEASILIKMRRNFERLNNDAALKALQPRIQELLQPPQTILVDEVWAPGEAWVRPLILDEKRYRLTFDFSDFDSGPPPLISMILNGRVVGEMFMDTSLFEISLQAMAGRNELRMTAVNRVCRPIRMTLEAEESVPDSKDLELRPGKGFPRVERGASGY